MAYLEKLRELQHDLEAHGGTVDVKFSPGETAEASTEQLAADAMVLMTGTKYGEDISNEVF